MVQAHLGAPDVTALTFPVCWLRIVASELIQQAGVGIVTKTAPTVVLPIAVLQRLIVAPWLVLEAVATKAARVF